MAGVWDQIKKDLLKKIEATSNCDDLEGVMNFAFRDYGGYARAIGAMDDKKLCIIKEQLGIKEDTIKLKENSLHVRWGVMVVELFDLDKVDWDGENNISGEVKRVVNCFKKASEGVPDIFSKNNRVKNRYGGQIRRRPGSSLY